MKKFVQTFKHESGGVMVSACMNISSVGELVFVENAKHKYDYLNISIFQFLKLNLGQDYYFRQVNDTKHTAYIVRHYILIHRIR